MNLGAFGQPQVKPNERGGSAQIRLNPRVIYGDVTIPGHTNGMSAGPVTIGDGTVVTVEDGATWTIV